MGYHFEEIIFKELKMIHSEIKQVSDESTRNKGNELLEDTLAEIMDFSDIARKEGLLALEQYACALQEMLDNPLRELKSTILNSIIDGGFLETMQRNALFSYASLRLIEYEALAALMFIEGMAMVQLGENPRHIMYTLMSMLPAEMKHEMGEQSGSKSEKSPKDLEKKKYIKKVVNMDFESDCKEVGLFNDLICNLSNRNLQRLMLNVEDTVLCSALKAASPMARKKVFANRSIEMAYSLSRDMVDDKYVKLSSSTHSTNEIISTAYRMAICGDIILADLNKYKLISEGDIK